MHGALSGSEKSEQLVFRDAYLLKIKKGPDIYRLILLSIADLQRLFIRHSLMVYREPSQCVYSLLNRLPFINNLLYYFRILEGRYITQVCGILTRNFPQNSSHNFP